MRSDLVRTKPDARERLERIYYDVLSPGREDWEAREMICQAMAGLPGPMARAMELVEEREEPMQPECAEPLPLSVLDLGE